MGRKKRLQNPKFMVALMSEAMFLRAETHAKKLGCSRSKMAVLWIEEMIMAPDKFNTEFYQFDLDKSESKTQRFALYVDERLRARFDAFCSKLGVEHSLLIRNLFFTKMKMGR